MAEVKIQEGESIENALRRFKRKVQQEDIIKDIKKHCFYLKPGDKRRAKQALARKRNRKKIRAKRNSAAGAGSTSYEVATDGVPRQDPSGVWSAASEFIWTAGEQLFFADKNFKNEPKRCKDCKAKREPGCAGSAQRERVETQTTCSACGKETTVPFRPTQGRPVFCKECFQQRKFAGAGGV